MPKREYFQTSFKGTNKRGVKLALYSHVGNKIFPCWEQNIPTLGMKRSHFGNQKKNKLSLSISLTYLYLCPQILKHK